MLKSLVLWGIRAGLRLPQELVDRVDELVRLRDLLNRLDVDCVLDVGANRGQFAHEVRGIGYDGAIVSFEPLPEVFKELSQSFRGDTAWTGHNVALGHVEGEIVMNVPNKTVNASILDFVSGENTRQVPAKMRRLDSFSLPYKRMFLKMDTQGFDLQAFAGATGILSRVVGLQSELSFVPLYNQMPAWRKALETYESAGFSFHNLSPVSRIDGGRIQEMNCFMTR